MKDKSINTIGIAFLTLLSCLETNAQGPFTIGTIHPNDSIIIIYDVQINNPLVPPTTTQISNQGTVSGSNFANQLTDDPDSGPANDPTITPLNMFLLPVTLLELKAKPQLNAVDLSWIVTHEENLSGYEIERSNDGRTFTSIGSVISLNRTLETSYGFRDISPYHDVNFYRLKMIDQDGRYKHSSVVKVIMKGKERSITSFPNPVTQNNLSLRLTNVEKGYYTMQLLNSLGQVVLRSLVYHEGGSAVKTISLPAGMVKGAYSLVLISEKDRFTNLVMIH